MPDHQPVFVLPNPSGDKISIIGFLTDAEIRLINTTGQQLTVQAHHEKTGTLEFSTQNISDGAYTLIIQTRAGEVFTVRMVKRKD